MRALLCSLTLLVWSASAAPAIAQPPPAQTPAPPKIWTVTVSAGLALTSGNTDTSSVNAAYDVVYNPQTKNVVKSDGLFLRSATEDELSAHRTSLNIRDEYSLTPRFFVFGQNQYLKDEFKDIEYLLAPTAGVGYRIFDTAATKLTGGWQRRGCLGEEPGLRCQYIRRAGLGRKAHADADRDHHADAGIRRPLENQ